MVLWERQGIRGSHPTRVRDHPTRQPTWPIRTADWGCGCGKSRWEDMMTLLVFKTNCRSNPFSEIATNWNLGLAIPGWCEPNMKSKWIWVVHKVDFSVSCFVLFFSTNTVFIWQHTHVHPPETMISTDSVASTFFFYTCPSTEQESIVTWEPCLAGNLYPISILTRLYSSAMIDTEVEGAGGEGDERGWDGWMASLTRWTWVWVNSGSWWWTGRPDVLRFMGSQRVGHDWATELNWTWTNSVVPVIFQGLPLVRLEPVSTKQDIPA